MAWSWEPQKQTTSNQYSTVNWCAHGKDDLSLFSHFEQLWPDLLHQQVFASVKKWPPNWTCWSPFSYVLLCDMIYWMPHSEVALCKVLYDAERSVWWSIITLEWFVANWDRTYCIHEYNWLATSQGMVPASFYYLGTLCAIQYTSSLHTSASEGKKVEFFIGL